MAFEIRERLSALLLENLNLKLVAFGLAVVLYVLAHGSQDAQRSISVGLEFLPPPENANRVLVSPIPPHLRATLRGPRSLLEDLRADDIESVRVDVRSGVQKRVTF